MAVVFDSQGGRTSLFLAAKGGNLKAVKALLAAKADPRLMSYCKYTALDVATTEKIRAYVSKAVLVQNYLLTIQLSICLNLIPAKRRALVWQLEGKAVFEAEEYDLSDFI